MSEGEETRPVTLEPRPGGSWNGITFSEPYTGYYTTHVIHMLLYYSYNTRDNILLIQYTGFHFTDPIGDPFVCHIVHIMSLQITKTYLVILIFIYSLYMLQ